MTVSELFGIFAIVLGVVGLQTTLMLVVIAKTAATTTAEIKEHITKTMAAHVELEHPHT